MTKEFIVAFQTNKKFTKSMIEEAIKNEFPDLFNITVIWENIF